MILFLHFQRSRPAEVIPFLRDRNTVLGDRERIHRIVQLIALRRCELLITVRAVKQTFKSQLTVCVGIALCNLLTVTAIEAEACPGKGCVLISVSLDDFQISTGKFIDRRRAHKLASLCDRDRVQGRVEHKIGQRGGFGIKIVPDGDFKRDSTVCVRLAVLDFVLSAVIECEADSR